jgi:hypothetical protein
MVSLYGLLASLHPNVAPAAALMDLIVRVGDRSSWSNLCVTDIGIPDRHQANAITDLLGDSTEPRDAATHILETLTEIFGWLQDSHGFSDEQFAAVLNRLGLPLHHRLTHDRGMDQERVQQESIARCWSVSPAGAAIEPSPLAIGAADAYWIWQHIAAPAAIERLNTVQTRIVLVRNSDEGVSATLTGSLVRWPQDIPPPPFRFVANPKSFGWIVEPTFVESFENTYRYLSKDVGIWPDDLVIEWNVSDVTGPILSGGSAGAAIALVAGGLLARNHLGVCQLA